MIDGLPDLPRWVEAHGLSTDPHAWRRTLGAGGCIGDSTGPDPVIVVWGEAPVADVIALAAELPDHTLLLASERDDLVAALPRICVRAILHTLTDPAELPDYEGAEPLPAGTDLTHLPEDLRAEITYALTHTTVWTAWVDGLPVSFAYAASRSERWFDIGVDTAPGARQLGLATIVAAQLIHSERSPGREPVWGATEDNIASLRLAARLGFHAVDELWVAIPVSG
ncbi:MAG: family N-acetyltransferase [Myxococcales bacterium]|nr:family N-acetyltransferase [Myxococcales bacterium]